MASNQWSVAGLGTKGNRQTSTAKLQRSCNIQVIFKFQGPPWRTDWKDRMNGGAISAANACSPPGGRGRWEIANRQSPIANRQSPIANRQSPVANRQSPIANRQSPIANRQSPIASRQSPVASRQSPVASRQLSVVHAEAKTILLSVGHKRQNSRIVIIQADWGRGPRASPEMPTPMNTRLLPAGCFGLIFKIYTGMIGRR